MTSTTPPSLPPPYRAANDCAPFAAAAEAAGTHSAVPRAVQHAA